MSFFYATAIWGQEILNLARCFCTTKKLWWLWQIRGVFLIWLLLKEWSKERYISFWYSWNVSKLGESLCRGRCMWVVDHIRGQLVSIETNLIFPKRDKDSNSYSIQHRNSDKRKSVQLKDFPLCPGQTFILKQKIYQCEIFLKISMLIFNKKKPVFGKRS